MGKDIGRYEKVEINKLIPYKNNARTHSVAQIKKIQASIKEFGFINPVLIDGEYNIIAGHGRIEAAKLENMKDVPCLFIEGLTKEQKQAYIIADNRLALDAEWDMGILKFEMKELKDFDFNIELTGFDFAEINEISLDDTKEVVEDDFVMELSEEPKAKLGDVYQLGKHRLVCGDSVKDEDVDVLMNGQKAEMVFTDPPYALFGNSTGVANVVDDNMVRPFFKSIMQMLQKHTVQFGHIYMCCDWHSAFSIESCAREVNLKAKNMCIWDKGDGGVGAMYQQCYEIIWFFDNSPTATKTMAKTKSGVRVVHGVPNIWRQSRVGGERLHNAQKPVEIIEIPITNGSKLGDIVLDLFGGSGSTLIACEQLNRICYMMELSPKYIDVIISRWETFTGNKAVKINE